MNDKGLQKDFSLISLTLLNNVEDKNQYKEERKSKIDKILKNNFILPNVLLLLFFFFNFFILYIIKSTNNINPRITPNDDNIMNITL